jgi:multiple sugar transport system substrate-binding protein
VIGGATILAACAPQATSVPATAVPAEPVEDTEVPEEPAEEPVEEGAPTEKITVTFWDVSSPEDVDGIAKAAIIERFEEKNTDIEIDKSYKPTTGDTQLSEALITAIAGGNPPDAAYFDRFVVPAWAAEGSLTDLTDLADGAGIVEDDYFPFAWEEASGWKNRLWALPYDTDDRALYYNKELVRAAGYDPENMPVYAAGFD